MSRGSDATQVALTEDARSGDIPSQFLPDRGDPQVSRVVSDALPAGAYLPIADAMLPRWRRVLAAAPSALERKRPSSQARGLFHTTASALASALWSGAGQKGHAGRSLPGAIESALVGWQLTHGVDGRPRSRNLRRNSLTVASTHHVVVLLSECSHFQTQLLLSDLAAHLKWLASCRGFPPWIEARVVSALAEGGVLLRDRKLVAFAESRAAAFCADDGTAGWNSCNIRGDLSLVSAALDPLARVYSLYQWEFLRPTLCAMGELLELAVDRAGAIGGLRNILRLPFPLPFGAETLVRRGIKCTRLAFLSRAAAARIDARALLSWGEDLVAMVGPSVVMSSMSGLADRLENPVGTTASSVWRPGADAGISICKTPAYDALVDHRRGGAIRIRWARTGHSQEDHGLRAVFDSVSLTSESNVTCGVVTEDAQGVTVSGALAVDDGRILSGLTAAARNSVPSPRAARRWLGLRPSGERYTRRIRFEPTRVTIIDSFRLRRAADLVLIGANGLEDHPGPLGESQFHDSCADAMVLEETTGATITRVFEHGRLVRREVSQ